MHTLLENKLTEAYEKGVTESKAPFISLLVNSFRAGLDDDIARNVDAVEDITGLVTLAYDMGLDSSDMVSGKVKDLGVRMAEAAADMAISLDEWRTRYRRRLAIVEAISRRRRERAKKLCEEAGLDGNLLGIHPNNAMCGYNRGEPWPDVNYNKVKACEEVLQHQFDANRKLEEWDRNIRGGYEGINPI